MAIWLEVLNAMGTLFKLILTALIGLFATGCVGTIHLYGDGEVAAGMRNTNEVFAAHRTLEGTDSESSWTLGLDLPEEDTTDVDEVPTP